MISSLKITEKACNFTLKSLWIDGMNQSNLMMTVRVFAWSRDATAWQDCTLTTDWLKVIGGVLYDHSYNYGTVHQVSIDARFFTQPLEIVLHEADSKGYVPIELRFHLVDVLSENMPCSVMVRSELGQLEVFGKRVKNLASKQVKSSCSLKPELPVVPDYRSIMSGEDAVLIG